MSCSPFFDGISIKLPGKETPLVIHSQDAPNNPYIKSLALNDVPLNEPIITHDNIVNGGDLVFEMSVTPDAWGSATLQTVGPFSHVTSPQAPLCY